MTTGKKQPQQPEKADSLQEGNPLRPERSQPAQPSEESGSTGRRASDADTPIGQDAGHDRYGQSGMAGPDRDAPDQKQPLPADDTRRDDDARRARKDAHKHRRPAR